MYRAIRLAAVSALTLLAGACAVLEDGGEPNLCPPTAILDDAGELVRFASVPAKGPGDVSFRVRMKYISGVCEVLEEEVLMELNSAMEVARGPANKDSEARFSYFVAILDKEKTVLTRTEFPMIARFQAGERQLEFQENVTVNIPKKATVSPKDFYVYFGFEMSPEELANNRNRTRRKQ